MPANASYSERIDETRNKLGVTKAAMADKLGLSWDGLNNKLTGKSEFDLDEVATIADWWGVAIDDLIGRKVPAFPVLRGGNSD